MVEASDDKVDGPPLSDEIAALLSTIEVYRRDNARLQAEIAGLKRVEDPDLRPLKMLTSPSEYEAARRDRRTAGLLRVVRLSGRLFSKPDWIAEWKRRTGRAR